MGGSLFSRVKTWGSTEDVVYSDLNAEFDSILNNLNPSLFDGYSDNVSQMQSNVDPGGIGTESLATSTAGEFQRIRNMFIKIVGGSQWYSAPITNIIGLYNSIGTTGLTPNRLVSGRVRATSSQPIFLTPNGAALTATVKGATTNFSYFINGVQYTITSDVNITGLTAAPSTNNTALVNDTNLSAQDFTKYLGEDGSEIPIDVVGTNISNLSGSIAAFKKGTEYFIAEVGTNKLIKAKRGLFFDSTDSPTVRATLSDDDTITLLKLGWIFAKTDGTLTITYTNPIWSFATPSSPATNDYWFDIGNNTWKVFGVNAFSSAGATLVGLVCSDTTNCIGTRSFEFFSNLNDLNTYELILSSNTQVKSRWPGSQLSVWGNVYQDSFGLDTWDMSTDLDSGVSNTASTYYFFYRKQNGDKVISNIRPYNRIEDLRGFYHPHHSWRCLGSAFNDGSSHLVSMESYFHRYPTQRILPAQTATSRVEVIDQIIPLDSSGGAFSKLLPSAAYCRGQSFSFIKTSSDSNAITITPFGAETINGSASKIIATQYYVLNLISDGLNWQISSRSPTNQVVIGTPVTTDQTTSSTTYVAFSTTIAVSFVASISGKYRVYSRVPAYNNTNGQTYYLKVVGTSGSPTVNQVNATIVIENGVSFTDHSTTETIFTLVAGTSYTFELQGRVSNGTLAVLGSQANTEGSGIALIAEQIE